MSKFIVKSKRKRGVIRQEAHVWLKAIEREPQSQATLAALEAAHEGRFSVAALKKCKSLKQWDAATRVLYGFDSDEAMLAQSDVKPVLQQMRLPTLFVNAVDDPACV